ncbi:S9 family peptidase [Sphingomonas panacisoli]|uniref:S9 family peptidase n=2 Tax=Sphingomonas panacisoli TaxID=1813879 RepID=A0A5B8LNH6_9SPHN|nr:S9 family peptidase [Sphingomonas panacisoli]
MAILGIAATASLSVGLAAQTKSLDATEAAKAFGARDSVLDVSISPDGKTLAVIQPTEGRGSVVMIAKVDGSGDFKPVLSSSGSPDRLTDCGWASDTRLICNIYMIGTVYGDKMGISRMMAINADGTGLKELTARQTGEAMGFALNGGDLVDWTGGKGDGSVLMTRVYIPEGSTGTITSNTREGLGVDRVDTRTLSRQTVEPPSPGATDYISDGRGHVRIMAIAKSNSLDQSTGTYIYRYRKKDDRNWQPLTTVTWSNYQADGFVPEAVDPDLDVVYGLEKVNGRTGLYKIALDGSLKKELVFDRPDAPIDSLTRVGRQHRVVGASWVTEKRTNTMFDPALKSLAAALSRALPKTPRISIVDASADEQQLVIFAASDSDPGHFYFFDRSTKRLSEIMMARPQLADVQLAQVKAIQYPAADGTMVPAYLTLPPGSDGKNLPVIVYPHGGPTARDEWNFDWVPQFFANRGFAVIQPNFRGSSGYGDAWFNKNGIRSWRTAIGDINDAGRWMIKQGIADPSKLAIVGWSYGGYAALQSQVVDPTLFKAVVAIAPVTDWGKMKDDAQGSSSKAQLDAVFGDAIVAEQGSPARNVAKFMAPVLMFQGDVDQNVPIGQSRLMAARLKGAGKKVEFYEYKGLDHQLEDNVARTDMLTKADAFLRSVLKM